MTKPLQVVITCDDGGLSEGIDTAVIELHEAGLVSAVSVMSNMPYAKTGLSRYKKIPELEIGAHLTLSEGQPLTSKARESSLAQGGVFKSRDWLFTRGLFLSDSLLYIIQAELDAQMQVFIEQGIQPEHITTHHHFHMLPKFKSIIYKIAQKYDVKWVRNSTIRGAVVPNNPFIAKAQSKDNHYTFIEPDYIVLVMEWLKQSPQVLLSQLERLQGLIEVVIHPSTETDDTFPGGIMYQPQERYQEIIFMREFFNMAQNTIDVIQIEQVN